MNEGKWSIKRRRAPTTLPGKGGASNLAPGPAYLFAISQSGDGVRRQITFMACLQYDRARAVYSPVPASPTWQRAGPRPNAPTERPVHLHLFTYWPLSRGAQLFPYDASNRVHGVGPLGAQKTPPAKGALS